MQSRDREEQEAKQIRTPIGGQRTKLQLSPQEREAFRQAGYVPRWINNVGGRVEAAIAGGYEHVSKEDAVSLGHGAIVEGDDLGGMVSRIVDRREGTVAYLMKIPVAFYEEDQRTKEERNSQVDIALQSVETGGRTIDEGYTPE